MGVWGQVARVLEKQESLYSSELADIGEKLARASNALTQVRHELVTRSRNNTIN